MQKRGIIINQVFVYIVAIIVVSIIFLYGAKAVFNFQKKIDQSLILEFNERLSSDIASLKNDIGSIKRREYSLKGINSICFAESYQPPSIPSGINPLVEDSVASGTGKNVFLLAEGIESSFAVKDLSVEPDILCVKTGNNNLGLEIESMGNYVTIKEWKRQELSENNAPVLKPIGSKEVGAGELLEFTVSATDPDGDSISYSASGIPNKPAYSLPDGAFSWIPSSEDVGTHEVTFLASDGKAAGIETITITVVSNEIAIRTCEDLQNIRNNLNAHYYLANDIDCSDTKNWNNGQGFDPIRNYGGVLDGRNHVVGDLYISHTDFYVGLFGSVLNGVTIKNIGLVDAYISGAQYVGGFIGDVSGDGQALISNSFVHGAVFGERFVGGLIGDGSQSATIENSHFSGQVSGTISTVGGLVGESEGSIKNSYSTGTVSGPSFAGGLVGSGAGFNIENSYSTASVSGSNAVGGLAGTAGGTDTIINSYSTGPISGNFCSTCAHGGLVGSGISAERISGSYYNSEQGENNAPDGEPKTTAQMTTQSTYQGWDFDNVWTIDEGNDYPRLAKVGGQQIPWDLSNLRVSEPKAVKDLGVIRLMSNDLKLIGVRDIFFKPDGTKMYIQPYGANNVHIEYALSTPWDISTLSYVSDTSQFSTYSTTFALKPDGTALYSIGFGSATANTFSLQRPWELGVSGSSPTVRVGIRGFLNPIPTDTSSTYASGLYFKPDGTKMYFIDTHYGRGNEFINPSFITKYLYQLTLATPWNQNPSHVSSISSLYQESSGRDIISDLFFKLDGTRMYLFRIGNPDTGQQYTAIDEYTLGVPWDVNSAPLWQTYSLSLLGRPRVTSTFQGATGSFFFKPDGTKLYVTEGAQVYEYDIGISSQPPPEIITKEIVVPPARTSRT